jgi:signal transduction histidine kinase
MAQMAIIKGDYHNVRAIFPEKACHYRSRDDRPTQCNVLEKSRPRARISKSRPHEMEKTIMSSAVNKGDAQMSGLIERVRADQRNLTAELKAHDECSFISFISHDLRHLLTSVCCNAEFMSGPGICQTDREQLLADVRTSIHDMTDLLDSFFLSIRTGKSLHLQPSSMNLLIQRAVNMVRSHPDARGVELVTRAAQVVDVRIDSQRLGAAILTCCSMRARH